MNTSYASTKQYDRSLHPTYEFVAAFAEAEEQQHGVNAEREVTREEIKHLNEETASMSRNAVRLGLEAVDAMNHTLAKLPGQGERLSHVEITLSSARRGAEDG
jgi:hypothetical protein